jgi:hypothetical protein
MRGRGGQRGGKGGMSRGGMQPMPMGVPHGQRMPYPGQMQ